MGFRKLMSAVVDGVRATADIGIICACAGIIVGVFDMTGLGLSAVFLLAAKFERYLL